MSPISVGYVLAKLMSSTLYYSFLFSQVLIQNPCTHARSVSSSSSSLYTNSKHILELEFTNSTQLDLFLHGNPSSQSKTSSAYVIAFYAPWCPHCKHFVPVYNELAESILSYNNIPKTAIRLCAINCVAYQKVCTSMQIQVYPTVKAFNFPADKESESYLGRSLTADINKIKKFILDKKDLLKLLSNRSSSSNINTNRNIKIKNVKNDDRDVNIYISHTLLSLARNATADERLNDAIMSFHFMIAEEAPISLTENKIYALKLVLSLLIELLPEGRKEVEVYDNIIQWLSFSSYADLSDKIANYKAFILQQFADHGISHPTSSTSIEYRWKVCGTSGGTSAADNNNLDGYTCGIWLLFHYLTVSSEVYYDNRKRYATSAKTKDNKDLLSRGVGLHEYINVNDVMLTIRTVVSELFGCQYCRAHFLAAFDKCLFGRCEISNEFDFNSLQMWLWKLHNSVSLRILKEKAAEASPSPSSHVQELKASVESFIWPSKPQCAKCPHVIFTSSVSSSSLSASTLLSRFSSSSSSKSSSLKSLPLGSLIESITSYEKFVGNYRDVDINNATVTVSKNSKYSRNNKIKKMKYVKERGNEVVIDYIRVSYWDGAVMHLRPRVEALNEGDNHWTRKTTFIRPSILLLDQFNESVGVGVQHTLLLSLSSNDELETIQAPDDNIPGLANLHRNIRPKQRCTATRPVLSCNGVFQYITFNFFVTLDLSFRKLFPSSSSQCSIHSIPPFTRGILRICFIVQYKGIVNLFQKAFQR